MDENTKKVRNLLSDIGAVKDFENILAGTMLSDEEKEILDLHYKQGKSFGYIADVMGLSESCMRRKHRKMLIKIGKAIGEM